MFSPKEIILGSLVLIGCSNTGGLYARQEDLGARIQEVPVTLGRPVHVTSGVPASALLPGGIEKPP